MIRPIFNVSSYGVRVGVRLFGWLVIAHTFRFGRGRR